MCIRDRSHTLIESVFFCGGRQQTSKIRIEGKKSAWLNDIRQDSVTSFAGIFTAVVFSPSQMCIRDRAKALPPSQLRMRLLLPYDKAALAAEIRESGKIFSEEYTPCLLYTSWDLCGTR